MLSNIKKSIRGEYELATAINKTIDDGYRVGGVITNRVCHVSNSYDLWRFNLEFLREYSEKDTSKWNSIDDTEDGEVNQKMGVLGISHKYIIGNKTYINSSVVFSGNGTIWEEGRQDSNLVRHQSESALNKTWKYTLIILYLFR